MWWTLNVQSIALTLGTRSNWSKYTHRRMNPDHMHFYFVVPLMILHQLKIECSAKHEADVSLSKLASPYSFRGPEAFKINFRNSYS
jgi:hypothetical protein